MIDLAGGGASAHPLKGVTCLLDLRVAKCYLYAMSQPVKLSDALVLDARLTAELAERSIAGQIEFWARIGKAVEPFLSGKTALDLRKASDQPLSELLRTVSLPEGRERLSVYLESRPYPHFEPAKDRPGLLVRIEQDGTRTLGRFVNREFVPVEARQATPSRLKKRKSPSNGISNAKGKRKR